VWRIAFVAAIRHGCMESLMPPFTKDPFCRCGDAAVRDRVGPEAYARYARSFDELMSLTNTMPAMNSPAFRLYEGVSACRR
jgi:hypothetical protein